MTVPTPILLGGHAALDFLNTAAVPEGEPVEFIPTGTAWLAWLVKAGLLDEPEARRLRRRFSSAELDSSAHEAMALREWLRPIVRRAVARGTAHLSATERQRLDAVLARGSRFRQLVPVGRGYVVQSRRRWDSADALLVPVAEAVADLLTTADFRLVRKCGSPDCTLWFVDRTKGHRRQWCSMAVCGNRAKVAAHRQRRAAARDA